MIDAPLCLFRTRVPPEWVDYNGHMSESRYLEAVGDNSDAFFRLIGIDDAYRATGHSLYTVETHLRHLGEAAEGDRLRCTLQLLDHDTKRVHFFHRVVAEADDRLLATAEQMLVHVDIGAARSAPIPDAVREKLADIARAHAPLARPDGAGRSIGIPR
ncbi:thioesterase family protein [Amycolatopsis sp. OK19-0408]|uniref:Thioesterase family protein n=1 Tax=Amycolatopsis iheyensis TaxID=2945988 RepID=A0A9X2N8A8_9PSEU|nr:thioesterase family protein [Amycolatopsis iheyensis]MCR6482391.1 thioesterase family protein [Amycolatopsis iheyensis]